MQGYPCKICGDFPVNSQLITCKSYILFNAISTCVPKVRNYGDFRQHVIPTVITCLLRGTPCDTGFSYTFYRGNICSVQVGDLAVVGDHITVPLTRISCNTVFSKSHNVPKAGTLCKRQIKWKINPDFCGLRPSRNR